MVAKVFRRDVAHDFVTYATEMFDHSPIDWLVRYFCEDRRQKILVRCPNPVHHKGEVSSFKHNKRRTDLIT